MRSIAAFVVLSVVGLTASIYASATLPAAGRLNSQVVSPCMVGVIADAPGTPGRIQRAIVVLYPGEDFEVVYTATARSEELANPFVSANGERVYFLRYGVGNSPLVVLDLATGQVSEIALPAEAARWTWRGNLDLSPDGTRIVFEAGTLSAAEIENPRPPWIPWTGLYIMNLDGTGLHRVRSEDTYNVTPDWSPDAQYIAFSMSPNGDFSSRQPDTDIYIVEIDGSNVRRLTNTHKNVGPKWSPDGRSLLFSEQRDYLYPGLDAIMVMELATQRTRRLGLGNSPQWTPDGRWISYWGEDGLYVMRPDGTDVRQVMQMDMTHSIAWWQGADVEACIGGE